MKHVLILFAHPDYEKSLINKNLLKASQGLSHIEVRDLYELYPDFLINIKAEQEALRRADVVIFQYPFYWYSSPSLLKEWMDIVLEEGFAFGRGGDAVRGKWLTSVVSAGSREDAYHGEGRWSVKQLLAPIAHTASFCHMKYLAPFVVFGSSSIRHGRDTERLANEVVNYRRLLQAFGQENVNLERAQLCETLNKDLNHILEVADD